VDVPETRYAKSGDVNIAYQVVGDGPVDLVFCPPFASNVELVWDVPPRRALNEALGSIARLIVFDKRGTGLSDRIAGVASLEERMDDVRAVMDAAGSARATLLGIADGGPLAILFAAAHPERCLGLVLWDTAPRYLWAPDFPQGARREEAEQQVREVERDWGTLDDARRTVDYLFPDSPDRDELAQRIARFERNSASPGGAADLYRMIFEVDVRPLLPGLQAPVLLLSRSGSAPRTGADPEDESPERSGFHWPERARYLASVIPTARLFEVPGTGGGIVGDGFDLMLEEISRFATSAAESAEAAEPDRVLASVLFTDIVDSTAKAVELGDRRWRDLVTQHHALVRRELMRFKGRELDTAGDGFFASFDGPARAIRCACAVRDAVGAIDLEVRAGIHTGECEQVEGKITGVAVATGARIAGLAMPGEVLVSSTVRDLVAGSGIAFEDRGLHELKGLPERRHVFAVVGT
jgi:class 3 adenylate cyclase/pimeloyl-ACP methyl ester carboxylesterase